MRAEKTRAERAVSGPAGFWEHPALLVAVVLVSALPLLMSTVPPLVDLPGHMARYRIETAHTPVLAQFYRFEWALIGNLGIDLLIIPMAKLFGLELGVKLIVIAIPALTVAGFVWVAYEVHGRVPPTIFFALPFAYNFPFFFGFVNFALSMAFAFLAFALWLRLGRLERLRLRAVIFLPLSMAIWLTHTYGWGTLGLLAFSAELIRYHDRGHGIVGSAVRSAIQCLSLTPPLVLMLIWRSGHVGGNTTDWFNYRKKIDWVVRMLRDRWQLFDQMSLWFALALITVAASVPQFRLSRHLIASALTLTLVFALLPRIVFGSAYADMRLAPFIVAVALLAIRIDLAEHGRLARYAALAGLAFFAVRTTATAISIWLYGRSWDTELAALRHVPHGARLASFVGTSCRWAWTERRFEHLPGLATVRRHAFSNDQWSMAGAQPLRVIYRPGVPFVEDPSQMIVARRCPAERWKTVEETLATLPRRAFDYVWLIDPPPFDPALARGLQPIWRNRTSLLYKVVDRTPPHGNKESR